MSELEKTEKKGKTLKLVLSILVFLVVAKVIDMSSDKKDVKQQSLNIETQHTKTCYKSYNTDQGPRIKMTQANKRVMSKYSDARKKIESKLYVTAGMQLMTELADSGFSMAMNYLALMYSNGEYVEKDQAGAIKWYRASAATGDCLGQYHLGYHYYFGIGIETDVVKALELYEQSAAQGLGYAANNLGVHYTDVEYDFERAHKWLRAALEAGIKHSAYGLGDLYLIKGDLPKADKYLKDFAKTGHPEVLYDAAMAIQDKHLDVYTDWILVAAQLGYPAAKQCIKTNYKDCQ